VLTEGEARRTAREQENGDFGTHLEELPVAWPALERGFVAKLTLGIP
jgi:hypothetical protein